jgi:hypothetical protein
MPLRDYGCEDCFKRKERVEYPNRVYGKMICVCGTTMTKLMSVFARTPKKWEV